MKKKIQEISNKRHCFASYALKIEFNKMTLNLYPDQLL